MHPINRKWVLWQVAIPIFSPVILSGLFALAWQSGNSGFQTKWDIIVDITPWALTFYSITLISSTMNEFWPKLPKHPTLGLSLFAVAAAVLIYTAFMIIWRHDPKFQPGNAVYFVTLLLLALSITLSHQAAET